MSKQTITRQMPEYWKNIYLIGYMGTGKTTTAAILGELLDRQVIELDSTIEEYYGKSIKDIFNEIGEEGFRAFETLTLSTAIMGCHQDYDLLKGAVFSCGGGVPLADVNVAAMQNTGQIVLLTASPETILKRLGDTQDRPLLSGKMNMDDIRDMMELRSPYYQEAADITINTDEKTPEEVAGEIIGELGLIPSVS